MGLCEMAAAVEECVSFQLLSESQGYSALHRGSIQNA